MDLGGNVFEIFEDEIIGSHLKTDTDPIFSTTAGKYVQVEM